MTSQKNIFRICALTIAGSDCSGGAGLEADLKTFQAHGVYGMAAVTCVVAENPRQVVSIQPIPPKILHEQLVCCLDAMPPMTIKTGMLFSAPLIRICAKNLSRYRRRISYLVVDPVMVATSGKALLQREAIRELRNLIKLQASLVTPNLDEAKILSKCSIHDESQMEKAAKVISRELDCAVLLKGGHLKDPYSAVDFLWTGSKGLWLRTRRIRNVKTHGTGCTYSAAITANLALGWPLEKSVRRAKQFVTRAIAHSCRFGPWMALNHQV